MKPCIAVLLIIGMAVLPLSSSTPLADAAEGGFTLRVRTTVWEGAPASGDLLDRVSLVLAFGSSSLDRVVLGSPPRPDRPATFRVRIPEGVPASSLATLLVRPLEREAAAPLAASRAATADYVEFLETYAPRSPAASLAALRDGAEMRFELRRPVTLVGTVKNVRGEPVTGWIQARNGYEPARVGAVGPGKFWLPGVPAAEPTQLFVTTEAALFDLSAAAPARYAGRTSLLAKPNVIVVFDLDRGSTLPDDAGRAAVEALEVATTPEALATIAVEAPRASSYVSLIRRDGSEIWFGAWSGVTRRSSDLLDDDGASRRFTETDVVARRGRYWVFPDVWTLADPAHRAVLDRIVEGGDVGLPEIEVRQGAVGRTVLGAAEWAALRAWVAEDAVKGRKVP